MSKLSTKKNKPLVKIEPCCNPQQQNIESHPDHSSLLPKLNRVKGQMVGIEKMIEQKRYCVDILIQFRAAMAALRALEITLFESHLNHCVNSALLSQDPQEVQKKIKELTELLSRRTIL